MTFDENTNVFLDNGLCKMYASIRMARRTHLKLSIRVCLEFGELHVNHFWTVEISNGPISPWANTTDNMTKNGSTNNISLHQRIPTSVIVNACYTCFMLSTVTRWTGRENDTWPRNKLRPAGQWDEIMRTEGRGMQNIGTMGTMFKK